MPALNWERSVNSAWLEDFLILLESGNFSRAAERRFVGQPTFSRRIMALEEWLGATLIDRSTHTVKLTPAGERFKVIAEDILRRLHLAQAELQQISTAQMSRLRFAATHALSLTFFPSWLRNLETAEPPTVELVADHMAACESLMIKGEVQFLLCHHHELAHTRFDAGFTSAYVGQDCLLPVAAPQLLANTNSDEFPRIEFTAESGMGRILSAVRHGTERRQIPAAFTSHLASVLAAMARAGRGIAWCPLSLIEGDLKKGDLVEVSGVGQRVPIEIRLWRSRSRQSPVAEAFWRSVKLEESKVHSSVPIAT
jgi:DNA-binding transcriptional LysR family regulator